MEPVKSSPKYLLHQHLLNKLLYYFKGGEAAENMKKMSKKIDKNLLCEK